MAKKSNWKEHLLKNGIGIKETMICSIFNIEYLRQKINSKPTIVKRDVPEPEKLEKM